MSKMVTQLVSKLAFDVEAQFLSQKVSKRTQLGSKNGVHIELKSFQEASSAQRPNMQKVQYCLRKMRFVKVSGRRFAKEIREKSCPKRSQNEAGFRSRFGKQSGTKMGPKRERKPSPNRRKIFQNMYPTARGGEDAAQGRLRPREVGLGSSWGPVWLDPGGPKGGPNGGPNGGPPPPSPRPPTLTTTLR